MRFFFNVEIFCPGNQKYSSINIPFNQSIHHSLVNDKIEVHFGKNRSPGVEGQE